MTNGLMFSVKAYIVLVEDTGELYGRISVVRLVQVAKIFSINSIFPPRTG